ncbi:hypothetical protein J4573_42645 [Actinomadura barringtoniae]|uniref:Galactokinase n=1 Tax=Actinomadura barringtoniae TaxID=1427535 RepID=A0A939PJF8_9ACTN|nr:hypothetical protein [Actinomadura barringtoniae]MBO2453851.1 hypothetical protein [Actinomadura barringtoniae]
MINTELAVDPEVRVTAHVYERAYGSAPAGAWRAPGGMVLLNGSPASLGVALPWGVIIAAGVTDDGSTELYSMNHHADRFSIGRGRLPTALASGAVPAWAVPTVEALIAQEAPGVRLVVNCELPAATELLTGAETACVVSMVLEALCGKPELPNESASYNVARHAREAHALVGTEHLPAEHLPCDLTAAGLRLLIMDVGVSSGPGARTVDALPIAALRAGNLAALGPALTEAHVPGESTLDTALAAALSAGALGGLAVGRCAVALVPMTAVPNVRATVTAALSSARRPPRFLTAVPAAGATRAI